MLRLCLLLILLPAIAQAQATLAEAESKSPPAAASEQTPEGYYDVAVLQGLNKVTARISELEATLGTAMRFGNLEIIVKRCWQAPPSALPENAALLEIIDRKPGEAPEIAYNGWMFSSSPSLAGIEHPVYDVTVLRCERRKLGSDT